MFKLTEEQKEFLLKEIEKNMVPLTNITNEMQTISNKEAEDYIKTENRKIENISPLTIYFIISKLTDDKQIQFIKNNIKYIKNHDEDIFLYRSISPKSLANFISFNVLKEIKNIDKEIFEKLITKSYENLFNTYNHADYINYYTEFYNEINKIKNIQFINGLYYHNRCCYSNIKKYNLNDISVKQKQYNIEFIDFLLIKYKNKINSFTPWELLSFTKYIEDINTYKEFINTHYDKFSNAFESMNKYSLNEYLGETDSNKQEVIINSFFEIIIQKHNIKSIINKLHPNIIIKLYKTNSELFKDIKLSDWVKICSHLNCFNDEFRNIIDKYKVKNIEKLFDTKYYSYNWTLQSLKPLKYIELKYRNNIQSKGIIEDIDKTTSVFSKKYINNLKEIKEMLKNNKIEKNNPIYKQHLANFIIFFKKQNIIDDIDYNFKEIEKLFYRIIMGESLTVLYKLKNINDIALLNRLGNIEFDSNEFTVEQINKYNVKHHKKLYKQFEKDKWSINYYKKLILKLMFIIGYNNTRILLDIDNSLSTLEHLVGNVYVKDITLDNTGNPVLNDKLINLIFKDKDHTKLKNMLNDKDNDLYKYFPRIINEWKNIKVNKKDKSLKTIIDYLKSDDITLLPKYYRLEGLFKYIGCSKDKVNETIMLHDQMLNRKISTIPRIKGYNKEYNYEILGLNDMESLTVGNKTNCCFTILGCGYSSLKHAVTSKNGRVFVIKKDDEVIAHSWIWRNGDLLCFDNIEVSKNINTVDFLDIYLNVSDEILKQSYEKEGESNCIKNITIGFNKSDKKIQGIDSFPYLISKNFELSDKNSNSSFGNKKIIVDTLPQPIENVKYSDSKNIQYIIRGNGIFNLGQSSYKYQDNRKEVLYYSNDEIYSQEYLYKINKIINGLRYIKSEKDKNIDSYKIIDVQNLKEVYCNEDWYIIKYFNDEIEIFNNNIDERAIVEINNLNKKQRRVLKKKILNT